MLFSYTFSFNLNFIFLICFHILMFYNISTYHTLMFRLVYSYTFINLLYIVTFIYKLTFSYNLNRSFIFIFCEEFCSSFILFIKSNGTFILLNLEVLVKEVQLLVLQLFGAGMFLIWIRLLQEMKIY